MLVLLDSLLGDTPHQLHKMSLHCEPMTLAMGGMAVAGAGANIYGQFVARDTHNVQEEVRRLETENAIEENRRRATHDYLTQTRLERTQQSQEIASVAQKSFDVRREAGRSVATSIASAAERGVAGRTVDMIAYDFDRMAFEETGRLKSNQQLSNQQHNENIRAQGTEWQNRVTSIKEYRKTPAPQIDFFGPILKAGAQTLSSASSAPTGSLTGSGFGAQASGSPNPGA